MVFNFLAFCFLFFFEKLKDGVSVRVNLLQVSCLKISVRSASLGESSTELRKKFIELFESK